MAGFANNLSGYILLQVEKNGEAWHVYPENNKRYYLGRPTDAFKIMRELGLGIAEADFQKIAQAGMPVDGDLELARRLAGKIVIQTEKNGEAWYIYPKDLKKYYLGRPADASDCNSGCGAKSLASFALENKGFAAVNGAYFDTSASKKNYYFFSVYNSRLRKMINEDQLKYWTTEPIMAFDENNKFYYFKDSREFKNVEYFESKYGVKLQAAPGNKPRLIEEGMNLLIEWGIDEKQRSAKALRNAIAYKG